MTTIFPTGDHESTLVVTRRTRALDWLCAAMVLVWGLMLALPGTTLAQSTGYAALYERFPEPVWATIFIVVGVFRVIALIVNGRLPSGSPLMRIAAAFLGVVIWGHFFSGFADLSLRIGVVMAPTGFFLVLLVADIFSTGRAAADYMRARHGLHRD